MKDHPDDHLADRYGAMDALDKIRWVVETNGWAVEPVAARHDTDPPCPAYAYSIGLPAAVDFPEIAVFGLAPVAARGLVELVTDARRGGTDIPLDIELIGLLDNELRCRFAPIDLDQWGPMFATAAAWYEDEPFEMVQLLFPDRNGFLPYESGYEQRMRIAQPVIGKI